MRRWIPLAIAAIAAAASAIARHPTGEMIVSMPWGGIFIFLMLMASYAGLSREQAFSGIRQTASSASTVFGTMLLLMLSALILAPFITSYLSALAIIPLASAVMKDTGKEGYSARAIAFTAIGASIGGFLLPTGSIHNLFIADGIEGSFPSLSRMALPAAIALALLIAAMAASMGKGIRDRVYIHPELPAPERNRSLMIFYACLVFVTVLASMGIFTWLDILIFYAIVALVFDRSIFRIIDYPMFLFIVLIAFALTNFRTDVSPWAAYGISEAIGSTAASLLATPSELMLKAVNAGSLGLMASFPAVIGLIEARKIGKTKEYCLWYIPVSLVISLVIMLLPI